MTTRRRTQVEMISAVDRQAALLSDATELFDLGGRPHQVLAMAVAVRVLVHHTGRSAALLQQLGVLDTWQFTDTSRVLVREVVDGVLHLPIAIVNSHGMPVTVSVSGLAVPGVREGVATWVAPLRNVLTAYVDFASWWNNKFIETDSDRVFSRRDLVLMMANKDGGAHLDPEVDLDYAAFSLTDLGTQIAMGEMTSIMDEPSEGWQSAQGNVAAASVRQIAFEVMDTLMRMRQELDSLK